MRWTTTTTANNLLLPPLVLLTATTITVTVCYGHNHNNNNDTEATFMALEKASALLEPPKELYQQIHQDLEVIRQQYPNVSDIRYISNWVPGRLLCNHITGEALQRLNQSDFGPIKSDSTGGGGGGGGHYMILTFPRAYNTPVLINKLKENNLLEDSYDCRVDGIIDGKSNIIYNYDKTYTFHRGGSGPLAAAAADGATDGGGGGGGADCSVTCSDKHYWTFSVRNGTAVLIKESQT